MEPVCSNSDLTNLVWPLEVVSLQARLMTSLQDACRKCCWYSNLVELYTEEWCFQLLGCQLVLSQAFKLPLNLGLPALFVQKTSFLYTKASDRMYLLKRKNINTMQGNTLYLEFKKKFVFFILYLKLHRHFIYAAERIFNSSNIHFCMTTILSYLCKNYRLTKTKCRHKVLLKYCKTLHIFFY